MDRSRSSRGGIPNRSTGNSSRMGMGMPGMMQGQPRMPGMMAGQTMMHGQMGMMPGQMGMMHGQTMPGQMAGHTMPGQMPGQTMHGQMPGQMHGQMQGQPMPGQIQGQMHGQMPGQPMQGMMPGMGGMPGAPQHTMGMSMPGMMPGVQQAMPGNAMGVGMTHPQQPPAVAGVQPSVVGVSQLPQPATPPQQQPVVEWAIPQQKRVGYMAQFQSNDRAKTGFLAAVQARNVLLQTGLAQQTLATVWNLADIDKDGKLNVEEFILAMHLCEMGMKGEPLPGVIPLNLVPPSMRKNQPQTVSTPGSGVQSGVQSGGQEDPSSPASFEDRRRENWEAGAHELNKRRASLLEQQKKEKEDRARKDKEEQEQRDKLKREAEARKLAELEARRSKEREMAREREEMARRLEEQREHARKEMERQRLLEWEKSRKSELESHRQRETEKVINLRAKKESLNGELESLKSKIEGLSTGIADTRTGVTDVKSFIDGMRSSRDTKMSELNGLKDKLKDQNQRLLQVTQERAKLESKNKVNQVRIEDGRVMELTDFDLKKADKLQQVESLRENIAHVKEEEENKKVQLQNNKEVLNEHREKLKAMIETCKALHQGFDEKRREIRAEKQKKILEWTDPNHAWGGAAESPSFDDGSVANNAMSPVNDPFANSAPVTTDVDPFFNANPVAAEPVIAQPAGLMTDLTGYVQYRALFDYEARNTDELAFKVGDIIMVHPEQDHEPGWLGGNLNGMVGWFPEAFAERVVEGGATDQTLQPIAEVPENGSDSSSFHEATPAVEEPPTATVTNGFGSDTSASALGEITTEQSATAVTPTEEPVATPAPEPCNEMWISSYPYASDEPGDLTFESGELINVVGKAGDWWTGVLGNRTGVFPFNYVEPAPQVEVTPVATADVTEKVADLELEATEADESEHNEDKSGKKLELASVIAPYDATSKEQLSLAKGQMVIIRKKTETGWWQGELQAGGKGKKRSVGWFPASYVKLLSGDTNNDTGADDSKTTTPATVTANNGGDRYTALFPYIAQYEDELSFEAGNVITVTEKEEEAWWRGEVDGRNGVFPSNYVEPAP